jgi:hypothetical protein
MTQQTIAQLAYARGCKPNKREAQRVLQDVYNTTSDPKLQFQLAWLYNYFMPAPIKTPKTAFEWVATACETSGRHAHLRLVHVGDDGFMVATNGQQMHVAPADRPQGWYHPATGELVKSDEYWDFPNYRRVMPSPLDLSDMKLNPVDLLDLPVTTIEERQCFVIEGACFDMAQVQAAKAGMEGAKVGLTAQGLAYFTDGVQEAVLVNVRTR